MKLRVNGSASLALCYVADGTADFFFGSKMKIWDQLPGQIILEEAGGKISKNKKSGVLIAASQTKLAKTLLP